MIFNVLQQAVTMLGFGDDEKDDDDNVNYLFCKSTLVKTNVFMYTYFCCIDIK